ncbi:MAG: YaiI/YqxD family protein [Candidatus Latescibacteria bacterium]|jgi:uncharacterized protein|nr:YaiI/YqxD family protein [Candidatus Latescibacterota bacterium]
MPDIFVDADACPVKQEIYRVADRYDLKVFVVSNTWMRIPREGRVELIVVDDGFDAADDDIVERVSGSDIVITEDIPLASRALEKGAKVVSPRGRVFTRDTIGNDLANRELMSHLRETGVITGGPSPFDKRDRSQFLQRLDDAVQAARKEDRTR